MFSGFHHAAPFPLHQGDPLMLDAPVGVIQPGSHGGGAAVRERVQQRLKHLGGSEFDVVVQQQQVAAVGMAPADVLAKTMQPVTDVISAENRGTVEQSASSDEDGGDADGDGPKPPPFVGKGGLPLL